MSAIHSTFWTYYGPHFHAASTEKTYLVGALIQQTRPDEFRNEMT